VSSLTEGRGKFAAVDAEVREIHGKLINSRDALRRLVEEDSAAFNSVMEAFSLPKETEDQRKIRAEAVEQATRLATQTPLHTARISVEILQHIHVLVKVGNPNARCDAAVGAQLAFAALKGAQYNVLANIKVLKDNVFAEHCRKEILELVRKSEAVLQQIDSDITGQ
jgi:formiminotetrahydrofolate cyclodeaminase